MFHPNSKQLKNSRKDLRFSAMSSFFSALRWDTRVKITAHIIHYEKYSTRHILNIKSAVYLIRLKQKKVSQLLIIKLTIKSSPCSSAGWRGGT